MVLTSSESQSQKKWTDRQGRRKRWYSNANPSSSLIVGFMALWDVLRVLNTEETWGWRVHKSKKVTSVLMRKQSRGSCGNASLTERLSLSVYLGNVFTTEVIYSVSKESSQRIDAKTLLQLNNLLLYRHTEHCKLCVVFILLCIKLRLTDLTEPRHTNNQVMIFKFFFFWWVYWGLHCSPSLSLHLSYIYTFCSLPGSFLTNTRMKSSDQGTNDSAHESGLRFWRQSPHCTVQFRAELVWKALAQRSSAARLMNSSEQAFIDLLYCCQGSELVSLYGTAQWQWNTYAYLELFGVSLTDLY